MAARSIAEYRAIEAAADQNFYSDCGSVFARDDAAGIATLTAVADELGVPIKTSSADDATASGPCRHFNLPSHFSVIHEASPAGFVDPRRMGSAQRHVARNFGAWIKYDEVVSVDDAHSPTNGRFQLATRSGESIWAERVLYATGAYGTGIQSGSEPLALRVRPEVVMMAEVTSEQLDELADMPSIIYLLDHDDLESVYLVPPTRYPDGKVCIKIGPTFRSQGTLHDRDQMTSWMQGGTYRPSSSRSSEPIDFQTPQQEVLKDVLTELLPSVRFVSWESKPCLITETESRLPFIDHISDDVVVAVGGNGHAAKSSDAIGELAAGLALNGSWVDQELSADRFKARFGAFVNPTSTSAMARHRSAPE